MTTRTQAAVRAAVVAGKLVLVPAALIISLPVLALLCECPKLVEWLASDAKAGP